MNSTLLKIKPVGGVGQIGSNMTLIETKKTTLLIDAGILFPSEDFFDINYLIPDLESLIENPPTDLVITHGHEDHIGAIRHVLDKFPNIKIHAPRFAVLLIRNKFDYLKISVQIQEYDNNSILDFNDIEIHPIHVNHSIPDTNGLLIKDRENRISTFLVSDFKIDPINPYEREFDFKKLIKLSKDSQVRVLLPDSTNILSTNLQTPSEALVLKSFQEIFKRKNNRIFITCFSSNIQRIQSAIVSAKESKRRILLYGRSMINYANTAVARGLIEEGSFYTDPASLPNKNNLVVLASGCQGDFRGTFRRIAKGEDTHFKLTSDDLFILSSKAIPGSEKRISLLENEITEQGVEIISSREMLVHVSGHPGRSDLLQLYENYCPNYIVPIHGESLFLKKHIEFINEKYPSAKCTLLHNFDEIHISSSLEISTIKGEPLAPILIHGNGIEIEKHQISKRRKLATTGCIFLSIKRDSLTKRNISFEYTFEGLPNSFTELTEEFDFLINSELSGRKIKLLENTAEELRIVIRRYVHSIIGYKPITIVHFV